MNSACLYFTVLQLIRISTKIKKKKRRRSLIGKINWVYSAGEMVRKHLPILCRLIHHCRLLPRHNSPPEPLKQSYGIVHPENSDQWFLCPLKDIIPNISNSAVTSDVAEISQIWLTTSWNLLGFCMFYIWFITSHVILYLLLHHMPYLFSFFQHSFSIFALFSFSMPH